MKYRICYIFGGAERTDGGIGFLNNLSAEISKFNFEQYAVLAGNKTKLLNNSVREFHIEQNWRFTSKDSKIKLLTILNSIKPDLIHIFHPAGYFGAESQLHVYPLIWKPCPIITTIWGLNLGSESSFIARLFFLYLFNKSNVLTAHDYKLIKTTRFLSFFRRIHFLPVGTNIHSEKSLINFPRTRLKEKLFGKSDHNILCYFGGFDSGRGIEELVNAVEYLVIQKNVKIKLLFLGWQRHLSNSKFDYYQHFLKSSQIRNNIELTPFLDDKKISEYLKAADLCVFPFRKNSLGRTSLMAALSVGARIVLCVDKSYAKDLNQSVLISKPNSTNNLAQKILYGLKNPRIMDELSEKAYNCWKFNFSWPIIAQKHYDIYQEFF